jgi:hypothetical protein
MAFSASGLYFVTWRDILDATQLAIDLSLTTHKVAMYTDTKTPNYSSDSAFSATNEVSGTGYTAGGTVVASPVVDESPTGSLRYDIADTAWTSSSIALAHGAIIYADALGTNDNIVGITFGADYTSSNGTFTIQWSANGVFAIDLTP